MGSLRLTCTITRSNLSVDLQIQQCNNSSKKTNDIMEGITASSAEREVVMAVTMTASIEHTLILPTVIVTSVLLLTTNTRYVRNTDVHHQPPKLRSLPE